MKIKVLLLCISLFMLGTFVGIYFIRRLKIKDGINDTDVVVIEKKPNNIKILPPFDAIKSLCEIIDFEGSVHERKENQNSPGNFITLDDAHTRISETSDQTPSYLSNKNKNLFTDSNGEINYSTGRKVSTKSKKEYFNDEINTHINEMKDLYLSKPESIKSIEESYNHSRDNNNNPKAPKKSTFKDKLNSKSNTTSENDIFNINNDNNTNNQQDLSKKNQESK